MSRCLGLLLAALAVLGAACGGRSATPSTPAAAASPAIGGGSPSVPTPTAQVAKPAQSPSPGPGAGASPAAAASPPPASAAASPPPIAAASPAAANPAATGTGGGVVFRIVPAQSEAAYFAREKFVERPAPNDAIGRTTDVSGEIVLERPGALRGRVLNMRVDLRTIASDSGRRDNYVRQNVLETDRFPYAEFSSTELAGPESYAEGEEATFRLPGTMKIRDQERPVTWDVQAKLDGTTLTGTATTRIRLTDFGIEPPRLAILSVEDEMRWEVRITAERAQ